MNVNGGNDCYVCEPTARRRKKVTFHAYLFILHDVEKQETSTDMCVSYKGPSRYRKLNGFM